MSFWLAVCAGCGARPPSRFAPGDDDGPFVRVAGTGEPCPQCGGHAFAWERA